MNNNSLPRKKPFVSYYFQDWEPVVLKENNRTAEKNERRLKIHATLRIDSCNNLYCVLSPSLSLSFSFRHFLRLSLSTNIHVHSNVHTPYTFPFFSMDPLSVYLPLYAPTIFKCNVPRLWDRTFLVGYCPLLRLPFDRVNAFTPFIYRVQRRHIWGYARALCACERAPSQSCFIIFFLSFSFSFFFPSLWLFCKLNFFFFFFFF